MRPKAHDVQRVWTVLDIVRWGTEFFERRQVDSPRLTIELMLCDVLQVRRLQLYTDHQRPLSKNELAVLRNHVQRRANHEPLQYILGKAEFYGLTFEVSPSVLIPRPETEILVDRGIRWLREQGRSDMRCLDIGTGSGCIPITIATHVPDASWLGIDIVAEAVELAAKNARTYDVESLTSWLVQDVFVGTPEGTFDLVTMNPPYIPLSDIQELEPEVKQYEPHRALTDDLNGLTFYNRFAEIASGLIAPEGVALLEIGFGQAPDVEAIMHGANLACLFILDLTGIPRIARISVGSVTKS